MSLAGELFWCAALLTMLAGLVGTTALILYLLRRGYTSPRNNYGPRAQRHLCNKCADPDAQRGPYGEWLCTRCRHIRWYD